MIILSNTYRHRLIIVSNRYKTIIASNRYKTIIVSNRYRYRATIVSNRYKTIIASNRYRYRATIVSNSNPNRNKRMSLLIRVEIVNKRRIVRWIGSRNQVYLQDRKQPIYRQNTNPY